VTYFVLVGIFLFVLLLTWLSRIILVAYVRKTEYNIIQCHISAIGLGGLEHEQYLRLINVLEVFHKRHLPLVFNRWRFALRLEQLRRKLWKTEVPMLW